MYDIVVMQKSAVVKRFHVFSCTADALSPSLCVSVSPSVY